MGFSVCVCDAVPAPCRFFVQLKFISFGFSGPMCSVRWRWRRCCYRIRKGKRWMCKHFMRFFGWNTINEATLLRSRCASLWSQRNVQQTKRVNSLKYRGRWLCVELMRMFANNIYKYLFLIRSAYFWYSIKGEVSDSIIIILNIWWKQRTKKKRFHVIARDANQPVHGNSH